MIELNDFGKLLIALLMVALSHAVTWPGAGVFALSAKWYQIKKDSDCFPGGKIITVLIFA
jgi:hypothetical protein